MALSTFDDKTRQPTELELETVLARSATLWKHIVASIAKRHAPIEQLWNFAGAKYGWSLRLRQRDRVLLYLIPQAGGFLAGIVLGEKAVQAARASNIRADVMEMIEAAKPYAEGRGIRLPVRRKSDAEVVLKLVELKLTAQTRR